MSHKPKVHQSVNYVTQAKGSTGRKAHVDYDGKTFLSIMQLILIVDLLDIGSYLTLVIYWLVFNTTFSSISAILWREQILSSIPIKLYIMMLSRKFHWNSILGFFKSWKLFIFSQLILKGTNKWTNPET